MSASVPPANERVSGKMLRTIVLWALIVVGAVSVIQYASHPGKDIAEITFTEFQQELERRNVDTVILSGRHVHGVFRTPVFVRGDTVTHFSLQLPSSAAEPFVTQVRQRGAVVVQDEDPPPSFPAILLTFAPYILTFMVGIVVIAVWHRQGRGHQA